jgi:uncharacterized membrane protein
MGVFYPLIAVVSLVGLFDGLYLTVLHFQHQNAPCSEAFDCASVLNSDYATIKGVPLAALGALAYFTVFSFALLIIFGYGRLRIHLLALIVLMSLMTGYLLYLQAFVLKHFCQWCLLSAAITITLLLLVIGARVLGKKNT